MGGRGKAEAVWASTRPTANRRVSNGNGRTNIHLAASARMGHRSAGTAQANECSVTVMSFQAQIDQSLLVGSMAISSARPTLGTD